jgi:cytochrome b subunit of formate dehydrogenase
MRSLLAMLTLAVLLGLPALADAGAPATITAADCLGCHSDKDLKKTVRGKSVSLFTDQAALKASIHRSLECVACHAGIKEIPHPEKLPAPTCDRCHPLAAQHMAENIHGQAGATCQSCHGSHAVARAETLGPAVCQECHQPAVDAYRDGVHGHAAALKMKDAPTCEGCHGPTHLVRPHTDVASPTHKIQVAETCARCHADRALVERRGIPIPLAFQLYQRSVHGRAVAAGKEAATCNDCHASHEVRRASDPASSVHRQNIPKTCGTCHAEASRIYLQSIHGEAMQKGVTDSPVCTDCHGEHSIPATHDPESPVSPTAVSKTCATCHDALRISEKYGLPGQRLATYRDSFHGLAARGGNLVAANCASCHGVHNILPSRDPRSTIHKDNLPLTCGTCHPGAGDNFRRGQIHVSLSAADAPVLLWVQRFYILTILFTIGGMLLHNGLDFLGKARHHYRRRGGWSAAVPLEDPQALDLPRFHLRMTRAERWQHGLLASSFIVLVYTGFALKFPEAWPFAWLAGLEAGYAWRSWIHRAAALVMVLAGVWHLGYLATGRGRGFLRDMLPRYHDVKEAVQNVGYLLRLRAERPAFDRFSYIEKAEYWAVVWGTVIMGVTGFALWFETAALRFVPLWVLDLATLIHYYEAWLATLAILVWHFYTVIFNPEVYPMNWTWLTGRISEDLLAHEHPREHARLRAQEAERVAEPAPPTEEGERA